MCYFFLDSMVSDEKICSVEMFVQFSLTTFFVFSCQKFFNNLSWCKFLWVYLIWVCLPSWICRLMSFTKFREFSLSFLVSLYFLSPSGALMIQMLDLLLLSHSSLMICSCFFSLFSLCYSDCIISIVLSSSSLILSSVIFFLLLSLFSEFLLLYFQFYNFYWVLFYLVLLWLRLFIFIFQKYLLKLFMMANLKSLFINAIIWFILVLGYAFYHLCCDFPGSWYDEGFFVCILDLLYIMLGESGSYFNILFYRRIILCRLHR